MQKVKVKKVVSIIKSTEDNERKLKIWTKMLQI